MDMKNFNINSNISISDNPLPYNFLAEKIVLSCLLINLEAVEITLKTVRVKHFISSIIKKFIKLLFKCTEKRFQ